MVLSCTLLYGATHGHDAVIRIVVNIVIEENVVAARVCWVEPERLSCGWLVTVATPIAVVV